MVAQCTDQTGRHGARGCDRVVWPPKDIHDYYSPVILKPCNADYVSFSDYTGAHTKLKKILLNGNNVAMVCICFLEEVNSATDFSREAYSRRNARPELRTPPPHYRCCCAHVLSARTARLGNITLKVFFSRPSARYPIVNNMVMGWDGGRGRDSPTSAWVLARSPSYIHVRRL